MSQKIINKRSSVITEDGKPKLPSSDAIDYGEIAINYADGVETLSIKNSANEIIEFKSKEYVDNLVDNNKEVYYVDFEYYQTDFNHDKLEELNNLAKRDDILIVTKIQNRLVIAIPSPYDENSSVYRVVSFSMMIGGSAYNSTTRKTEPKIKLLSFDFIYEYGIGHYTLEYEKEIALYTTGDGTQFLSDDGTYKEIIHPEPYILNYSDTPYELSSEELEKLRNAEEVRLNYYTEGGQAGGYGISAAVYNHHYHNYGTDDNIWTFYIDENYDYIHDFVGYIQASVNYDSATSTYIVSFVKLKNENTYLLTSETYKYSDLEAAIDQGKQIIFQMTSDSQPYIVHELNRQSDGIMMGCLVMTTDGIGAAIVMCGSDDIMFEPYTQEVIHLTGDGNSFLANDGTYKIIEAPQTNIYTCVIDTDNHTDYNEMLEAISRGGQILIKTNSNGLTSPYMCVPISDEATNDSSILCYPHPIIMKQNSDVGIGGSIITINNGGWCGYDSADITYIKSGDGNSFLANDGTYKEIATPTKVSELENDVSMVTLNDSTTIKESVDGTELVPIFDGENKAVSVTELVKGAKELFVITPTLEGEFPTILTKDYLNNGMPVINAGTYYTKSFTRSFMDMGKNFCEDYYIASPALESGEKATVIIANYVPTEPDRHVSFSIVPEINIIPLFYNGDGTQFLSDDGTYKTINVDTSAIEQRIDGVETTIEENELVTSTALNELNARMTDVETNKASSTHDHDDRYLTEHQDISHLATQDELNSKQDTLVSGTNIKTINGQSILGSGNIEIEMSGSTVDLSNYSTTEQVQAMIDASIITALNTEV